MSARRRWTRWGNRFGVWLFRRTSGRLSGAHGDVRVLMLTTPGRRTGTPRSTCVRYLEHGDELLVWGSGSGSPHDPDWFENLRAHETTEVQIGAHSFPAARRELHGPERDEAWSTVILTRSPQVAKYAAKAGRTIPVAVLTPLRSRP